MAGMPIDDRHAQSWREIEMLIEHFLTADLYLISTPMWNLSIAYALKYYIDCIIQPGYLFRYNDVGQIVPLVTDRKMVCSTSRGGDYSPGTYMHSYDFQEPYLRAIFGFVGVTDIEFINAEPMDVSPALKEGALTSAIERATDLANRIAEATPIDTSEPTLEILTAASAAADPAAPAPLT
jgi:FMN-dependent NADH-azoreductase